MKFTQVVIAAAKGLSTDFNFALTANCTPRDMCVYKQGSKYRI